MIVPFSWSFVRTNSDNIDGSDCGSQMNMAFGTINIL